VTLVRHFISNWQKQSICFGENVEAGFWRRLASSSLLQIQTGAQIRGEDRVRFKTRGESML
jgi:hypothetical protein